MTISIIYPITFHPIILLKIKSYFKKNLFFENKKLFLEFLNRNYFLIIQGKVDGKLHLDDTICKDNYIYCHL
jgi:hypothetical protein